MDILGSFVDLKGDISTVASKLSLKGNAAINALNDVKLIISILLSKVKNKKVKGFVNCKILFDPLMMMHNFDYYSGVLFQFVKENPGRHPQRADLLAIGGRYDSLIEFYRHPTSQPVHAVGISFSVMKLLELV